MSKGSWKASRASYTILSRQERAKLEHHRKWLKAKSNLALQDIPVDMTTPKERFIDELLKKEKK